MATCRYALFFWIASDGTLGDTYIHHPKILSRLYQQPMTSPMDSMISVSSSTLGSDTSLIFVLTPQVDTLMILLPIVLPTPLTS